MSNVVQFKRKETVEMTKMWEVGFARYIMAVGLAAVAAESEIVQANGVAENMNVSIRLMAEADYEKMTKVVTNQAFIDRAFVGHEAVRQYLAEGGKI